MTMGNPFQADVFYTSTGNVRQGDGPLTTMTQLDTVVRLDQVGEATFTLPAADPRTALIQAGCRFKLYDAVDGYLGQYHFRSKRLSESGGCAMLTVRCWDRLFFLTRYTTHFRHNYVDKSVDYILGQMSGWGAGEGLCEDDLGNTTIGFEGVTFLVALNELGAQVGAHLRLSSDPYYSYEFGVFGEDAGVRLTNLAGQISFDLPSHPEIALVSAIVVVEDTDEIYNRIIPLGAGSGVSQLTIEQATVGDYETEELPNKDWSFYYFIEDDDSIAAYARREKILLFPNIRPITNSDEDIVNAANALKTTAEVYLKNHLEPRVTYDVTVKDLRMPVRPGNKVRLTYRGVAEGYTYLDVDEDFYVLDVATQRSADGDRSTTLTICTLAERRMADTEVLVNIAHDLNNLGLRVPTTLVYAPVGPTLRDLSSAAAAEFTCRIGNEVLGLNYAILRFRTGPFLSAPANVRIAINGIDRTGELGGPWDGGGTGTEVELDITTYLINATGGLRQNHRVAMSCDSGSGWVEVEVGMLVTVQDIAVA